MNFEDQLEGDLSKDDVAVLEERFQKYTDQVNLRQNTGTRSPYFKSQWTNIHDGVQEHFSSHVLINRSSVQLPRNIYALKQIAKQGWMLYKKRECERRKRLREKMENERKIDRNGGAANILLSMVDTCEMCRKLFITVNLFWGVTLCDICYFNESVIEDIMKKRRNYVKENDVIHPLRLSESIVQVAKRENESFFKLKDKAEVVTLPKARESPDYSSPEIITRDEDQSEESNDIRPVSEYVRPVVIESPITPIIFEEEDFENIIDEENDLFRGYQFSQSLSQYDFGIGGSQSQCSQKYIQ